MKYMLLIYFDEQVLSETERQACYAESTQLAQQLHASGQYLAAHPLHPTSVATSVRWRDGKRFTAPDFNFWGVTFARDGNTFYASLRTIVDVQSPQGQTTRRGVTYLVRGELALRKLTVLLENVECPSLSPNNRLVAYKKRVDSRTNPWRFYVLDVQTMKEHPIAAESRSIDDQIEWLDDGHVLYASARSSEPAVVDVYAAAVEGAEPPRVFVTAAESPIVVR